MSPCSGHVPLPFNTCLVSLKYAISELKGRHTPTMQKSKGLQVHQANSSSSAHILPSCSSFSSFSSSHSSVKVELRNGCCSLLALTRLFLR